MAEWTKAAVLKSAGISFTRSNRVAPWGVGGTVNSGVECWLVKPKVRGSKPLRSAEVGWGEEGGT